MYARRHPQHRSLQITFALKDRSSCISTGHLKGIKRPQPPRILGTHHPFPHPTHSYSDTTTYNDHVACIFTSNYIHRLYIAPRLQAQTAGYTTCRARPTPVPETGEEGGQAGGETRQEFTARRTDIGIMIHVWGHISWIQLAWAIIKRTVFYIVWAICILLLTIWIPFFTVCLFKVLRSLREPRNLREPRK